MLLAKARKQSCLFMGTYPVPLEAILRAEKAILNSQLQARRALQSSSIFVAIRPHALPWLIGTHDIDVGLDGGGYNKR